MYLSTAPSCRSGSVHFTWPIFRFSSASFRWISYAIFSNIEISAAEIVYTIKSCITWWLRKWKQNWILVFYSSKILKNIFVQIRFLSPYSREPLSFSQKMSTSLHQERPERTGPCRLLKLRWMRTQKLQMEGALPWLVRWPWRACTNLPRDFYPALAACSEA